MPALSIALVGRGSTANDGTGDSARDGGLKLNRNARLLEALAQGVVISATTTAQPVSPTIGDLYIIPSGKTGTDWSAMTNGALALYAENDGSNAWFEITPAEGWRMLARDTDLTYRHTGSAWTSDFGPVTKVIATGSTEGRSLADRFGEVANVKDFGAVGDAVVSTTGVATATDATFTDASAAWVAADVGKEIHIVGAGTAGAVHSTTIASINSTTSIELTAVAVTTVASSAEYVYGTNDSTAIQAAIATGKTVSVPDAPFLVDADVLTMATAGQIMVGSPNGVTENEYRGARLITYDITGKVINVTAHGCLIQHVAIYSIGDPTSLYGFYANNTTEASGNNQDDVDFTLYDCHGYHMTTFCYVKGRSLTAIDNSFAGGTGTDVMFEREFPTSNVGAGSYHDVPYGFRKDQIRGNLTHGNTNFLKVVGTNRIYYRAIVAHNMNDIGGRLFEGAGADIIFAGNFTKHSSSTIYYFDAACESIQFLGETALGTPSDTDASPSVCVQFTAAATDIRVTGGTYGDCDDAAFRFDGNVASLNIVGATIKNWGQNATGTDHGILFSSGITVTDAVLSAITFIEGAGSDMPVYADGVTLTNVVATDCIYDTAKGAVIQGAYTDGGGNSVRSIGAHGFGTATPDRQIHGEVNDATTNGVTYVGRVTHTTSGTPATGIGVGIEYEVETSAGNNEIGGTTEFVSTDVTGASEDFDYVVKSMAGGAAAAERFRAKSTGALVPGSARLSCNEFGSWHVLAKSGAATSHTGSTSETTLATIALPAGALGANGVFRITTLWTQTNNANNKTVRYKLGSTTFGAVGVTSTASMQHQRTVWNRNAQNSQVSWVEATGNSFSTSTAACDTMAEDTSGALNITITAQLADGADTISLEAYMVEIIYGA